MTIITIQPGDSLYSLGKRFGVSVERIAAANGIDPHRYLVIGDSLIIPSPQEKQGALETIGFAYPFIDRKTLQKSLPILTYLAILSYRFKADGRLIAPKGDDFLITLAKEGGAAPLAVVSTVDESGGFNSRLAAALLTNEQAKARLIEELKAMLGRKGYAGLLLDLQYLPRALRELYPAFLSALKAAIAPLPLMVSLAPQRAADQSGALFEGQDQAALGAAADRALLMTFEWGHTFGPPMAVSPIDRVEQVVDFSLSAIPAQKLLLGLPNYGYDWVLPYEKDYPARSVSNEEAIAIARKGGAEIQFDAKAQAPYFRYIDRYGRRHEVWYEDGRSYQAKLSLLQKKGLHGTFIWNIMRFYQPLFTLINEQFDIIKIAKNAE